MGDRTVECAYIKLSLVRKSPTYEKDGSARSYEENYIVRKEDIEKTIDLIASILLENGIHCLQSFVNNDIPTVSSIAYITGMGWETPTSICTENRIKEKTLQFAKDVLLAEKQNTIENNANKIR